ncbi:response regulator [Flavobacterium sp. Sd200]|uniref:response regulator transcription factor n=1 Tax=Flavobacterium sp. Sd200 TaxID=2692211 RepID=UPI0013710D11|nr:response regulator transcription factor [Flavobacterium sp. Sd200]MXN91935.1 response regulator [Flavobacterium sp. Sd200]
MFKKIIVAEDIDSISLGLKSLLQNIQDANISYTKYCDEAFLKIKKAGLDSIPYELLITDLSFKDGNREEKITSGEELIEAVKKEQPNIKIIAYSIEERGYKIRHLMDDLGIDAYVCKGRESSAELLRALKEIYADRKYISTNLAHLRKPETISEMDMVDLEIIKMLSDGLIQTEIVENFKNKGQKASSISSIEKRIIKMKTSLMARNTTHLVSIAKDMGLI